MIKQNMGTLSDALRQGASAETLREQFEAQLKAAQNEVAAEKKAQEEENEDEVTLDELREEAVCVILDYLTAVGVIPEDMDITDEDIDELIEAIKGAEEEFRMKMAFVRMLHDMAHASEDEPKEEKVKPAEKKADPDEVLKRFLESLR
jgi:ATP-dependent protease HslVU (ClpYQ) peptidase subunit